MSYLQFYSANLGMRSITDLHSLSKMVTVAVEMLNTMAVSFDLRITENVSFPSARESSLARTVKH